MKTFLITSIFLILLSGCAQQNAFQRFNLSSTNELSEDSIQSFKMQKGDKIDGIVNVIYLNKVLPKIYKGNEYFYVYYYVKDKNASVNFTLNNEPSMLREKLPAENDFSYLTSFSAPWSQYYLLGFAKQGNTLNLKALSTQGASATIKFIKDK
jgi:hypothetical protein